MLAWLKISIMYVFKTLFWTLSTAFFLSVVMGCLTCPYGGIPRDIYHNGYQKKVLIQGQTNKAAIVSGRSIDKVALCQESASTAARSKYGQAILLKCTSTLDNFMECRCEFAVKAAQN